MTAVSFLREELESTRHVFNLESKGCYECDPSKTVNLFKTSLYVCMIFICFIFGCSRCGFSVALTVLDLALLC